jgi:hypothetical protein
MKKTAGRFSSVHVSGKLAKADYAHFVPEFERLVRLHGKLRLSVKAEMSMVDLIPAR